MNLQLTAFEPNLRDKRVRTRLANVLNWAELHLSTTSPEPIHHKKLQTIFGTSSNALSAYLRANLLIQVGTYVPKKQSYSYVLNQSGFDKLRTLSQHMVTTGAVVVARPENSYPELATLSFTYDLKSDRYWNPLQNIKREKKARFWAPYLPYNYDVVACAPTVLFQCAQAAGLPVVLLSTLRDYLDDRSAFRKHVAALTGLSLNDAKRLINSLFNGARLVKSGFCAAYRLMNHNAAAMGRLQADPQVTRLTRDIKRIWDRLELVERHKQVPSLDDALNGTAKPFQRKLKTSKQKWGYYFAKERQLLDAITEELRRAGIKYFTEHDGFRTDREIDVEQVTAAVKSKTGFEVVLSKEAETENNEAASNNSTATVTKHMVTTIQPEKEKLQATNDATRPNICLLQLGQP